MTGPDVLAPGAPRERSVRTDRRMNDHEAMMWTIEKDPFLASTFGSVTILDRSPDLDHLRARLLQMTRRIPRLHQRVAPGLGRLAPPEWQDDPDFDIDYHLRHIALPPPGTRSQLFDLAARFVHDPFDRTRPLWEFLVVEGLEGGRAAMVQKMHHTITDGEGGIRMSEQFIDLSRDMPDVPEIDIEPEAAIPVDLLGATVETVGHTVRRLVGATQRAVGDAGDALLHPAHLWAFPGELAATATATVRQITVADPAHSPLWTSRSLRRSLRAIDVDFDEAYRAAKALGGSLNDLFVAGAAGGAGAYHRDRGEPVEQLRMAMPVSTRKDASAGGNSFVPTRVLVPTGIEDPAALFTAVHAALDATRDDRVIGLVEGLAGLANLLPTSVLVRFARQQVETVDFTTSNLRAASFDLYIAGALVEGNYPLGPLAGTAFNLTMMSYRGVLNMGLHTDDGAVEDPAALRDCIEASFASLVAAGR